MEESPVEKKKILIISPYFPPSNLAAVHRSRLFAQHLPAFGWEPVILMVDEKFYEERLDWGLVKLLPENLRIEKVSAYRLTRPRLIGDIGLRAFLQLYRKAKEIIKKEKINFLLIPIPSFYTALLGRWLHASTGIKYGIDYIDPWVHSFPGSNRLFSRHWWSTKLAKILEPIAVKKASLITGVAEGYYIGVQERNPALIGTCKFGAMPYGGEAEDHKKIKSINSQPYLFSKKPGKIQLVYAGAMLPKAYQLLEAIFQSIQHERFLFENVIFHFIGTGKTANDPEGFNIKPFAEKFDLWQNQVFEYPARIPYLDVLIHLEAADGIFILGSTEAHYTPSKIYQALLAKKPVLAVLHRQSTAVEILRKSGGGIVIDFNGEEDLASIRTGFANGFRNYLSFIEKFKSTLVDVNSLSTWSAENITGQLAGYLDSVI